MVESKKCKPGCACARHKSSKCEPGCSCKRHTSFKQGALGRSCPEGCTCGKHNRPKRLPWESAEAKRAYAKEYARQRRAADPERNRAAARKWAQENPYYVKYRMTKADWQKIFDEQKGCCYLCGVDLGEALKRKRGVHIDHNHSCCARERTCGRCIRGLACHRCNQGIGAFFDDPERMRRAADALELAQIRLKARRAALENSER
jgi:hypothetical protein